MRIVCIGGGPAGLYFAALMKKADPAHDITVVERNRSDDTFGFGVVFSDATLEHFARADRETHDEIARAFAHWDDIDIHWRGSVVTSTGHGFSGLSPRLLLDILQRRCESLGVKRRFETEVRDLAPYRDADLILAADGVNSAIRARHAARFGRHIEWRPNRFVWLGTTCPFPAFTFIFKEDVHGLWRVHAYRYDAQDATFILETTDATWRRAGLDEARRTIRWRTPRRSSPTSSRGTRSSRTGRSGGTSRWSGTSAGRRQRGPARRRRSHRALLGWLGDELAMEDAIALSRALGRHREIPAALAAYEAERRPEVESLQRAAQVSLEWFETMERCHRLEPVQFAMNLLTRSLRVTHENLKVRDPRFIATVDQWFAEKAVQQSGAPLPASAASFRRRCSRRSACGT